MKNEQDSEMMNGSRNLTYCTSLSRLCQVLRNFAINIKSKSMIDNTEMKVME